MPAYRRIATVMRQEANAIYTARQQILRHPFAYSTMINYLYACQGKVVVTGMGKIGYVGQRFAMSLASTGTPAFFLHPGEAQHGDLGMLDERDVLFVLSNSGKTREVCETLQQARAAFPELPILTLTGSRAEAFQAYATFSLSYGTIEEACPLGLTPTTSLAVVSAILDGITIAVMEKKGTTRADYAQWHHGGYLGEQARKSHERS